MALIYNFSTLGKSQSILCCKGCHLKSSGTLFWRFSFLCFFLSVIFTSAAWGEFTHIAKKGESLSTISQQYHISISRIQEANDLEDTRIRIGQRLIIPNQASKVKAPSIKKKALNEGSSGIANSGHEPPENHLVKKGETLVKIGRRYNLQVKDLQEINELKGSKLQIGQILHLKREGEEQEELEAEVRETDHGQLVASPDIPKIQPGGIEVLTEEKNPQTLVGVAQSFLGVKYRRGGTSLVHGLDCSAFVQKVFRVVGVDLPRTAREQFEVGLEVARDALRLGDLVFFKPSKGRRPAHVGIYIGNEQFIHTSLSKRKVRIDSLNTRYFSTRFIGGRRIEEPNKQMELEKTNINYASLLESIFEPACSPSGSPVPNH
ncbi:MAG: NlpC/P60 family protein [Thermodesulfobacteriota bacterium]